MISSHFNGALSLRNTFEIEPSKVANCHSLIFSCKIALIFKKRCVSNFCFSLISSSLLCGKSEVMKLKQIICWTVVQPVLSRELMHDGKGWEKCFARRLKGKND